MEREFYYSGNTKSILTRETKAKHPTVPKLNQNMTYCFWYALLFLEIHFHVFTGPSQRNGRVRYRLDEEKPGSLNK